MHTLSCRKIKGFSVSCQFLAFVKWGSGDDPEEGFRAKEMDTITPPSIIALREEGESPIRELRTRRAHRWIDSLEAEEKGEEEEEGDDREDGRETDCGWSPLSLRDGMRIIKSRSHRVSSGLRGWERAEHRGGRSERWTSSRLLPGGQGSDCGSVSGLVPLGRASVCVCVGL